jgi:hypothetical protein
MGDLLVVAVTVMVVSPPHSPGDLLGVFLSTLVGGARHYYYYYCGQSGLLAVHSKMKLKSTRRNTSAQAT